MDLRRAAAALLAATATAAERDCQMLTPEVSDAEGDRFSSVNIDCNLPAAVMPLVDEVIRLVDLGMVRGNWADYP